MEQVARESLRKIQETIDQIIASEKKYVLKENGKYFAGERAGGFCITNGGPAEAEKMYFDEANQNKKLLELCGYEFEIEEYNPTKHLSDCLNRCLEYENKRLNGEDVGYAIRDTLKEAVKYLPIEVC